MRGIKSKIHNLMTLQVIKHLHLVLMIKYIFKKTELIHYHMDIKTYINQKNIYLFYIYKQPYNDWHRENVKHSLTFVDDIKNENLKAHLRSTPALIDEIKDKKNSEFEESCRKFRNDKDYKLANLLLKRNFLIKAVQEVNKELIKKKQIFTADFSYDSYFFFLKQTECYCKKEGYYNNNGTISKF